MKPAALVLQDLLRAHVIFLLHHDSSLSALFVRTKRSKFTSLLSRYWDLYLSTWSVLLHGNPVRNVFGGVKVAACGELGVGVGEEDRGSGEREVLEGFVGRIEGLVDLVVSKFGTDDSGAPAATATAPDANSPLSSWLGTGREPGAEDGVVFLGVGALSRNSIRDIALWMEDLYTWGEEAYGVGESPTSTRQARRPKKPALGVMPVDLPMKPPAPVTELAKRPKPPAQVEPGRAKSPPAKTKTVGNVGDEPRQGVPSGTEPESGNMDRMVNYLKLGYGTYWSIGGAFGEDSESKRPEVASRQSSEVDHAQGHYLIGLRGEVEDSGTDTDDRFSVDTGEHNSRTMLRTLTVELESEGRARSESQVTKDLGSHDQELATSAPDAEGGTTEPANSSFDSQDRNKTKKVRVVVYVNKPFVFTFLFKLRTESLAWDALYKSLHHQLAPLRKPLANSTRYRPDKPDMGSAVADIYDLIWDPKALTVHSTIPNIPAPNEGPSKGDKAAVWSRVEALNTHMQLLNTFMGTRSDLTELERTCKTSRGWWIVWSRVLEREVSLAGRSRETSDSGSQGGPGNASDDDEEVTPTQGYSVAKEIFLIRKASDHASFSARSVSASYVGGGGWGDGASRLAQGIGVDTKKYIEGLLSLNR